MSLLKIEIPGEQRAFKPGQEVTGTAEWHLDTRPAAVEARLCWFTAGQVVVESRTVEVVRFEQAGLDDKRTFRFRLPNAPYSFAGMFGALSWAVELVALPEGTAARAVLDLSPSGARIDLFGTDEEEDDETGLDSAE